MKGDLRGERVLLLHPGIHGGGRDRTYAPWGALCVATAARARGAAVEVADLTGLEPSTEVRALVARFEPTTVGVTAKLGLAARRFRTVVETVREVSPRTRIVAGGPLVSTYPELSLPLWEGVDAAVLGDGEEVLGDWLAGGAPPGRLLGPREVDLDAVGVPSWWDGLGEYVSPAEDWPGMGVASLHVAAARGCTRRCTFCYLNEHARGARFRAVSAPRLLADLEALHERTGATGFYFVDDCFIDAPPRRLSAICAELRARGSPWRLGCDIQLPDLEDADQLAAMHAAGFRAFYLGIEAASSRVRRTLGKGAIAGDVVDLVQRALDAGFFVRASIGMGWPGESEADVLATLDLIDRLPTLVFDAFRYAPLPGAPLTRLWTRSGRTPGSPAEAAFHDYSEYFGPNPSNLPDDRFEALWRELVARRDDRYSRWLPSWAPVDAT